VVTGRGQTEYDRLDQIAVGYDPSDKTASFDYYFKRLQANAIEPHLSGERVLELGCATGELTALLAPVSREYHVVEGSQRNIEVARERVPGARFLHALWEEFEPDTDYSDVLLVNALEHAADPLPLLENARRCLMPGGRIHVMVPNGHSLHRLVGVELGMLKDPVELNDADGALGHYRNYTIDSLLADLRTTGLEAQHWEGIFLKLVSNAQMLQWDWNLVSAIARVGRRFPEHCAVLYVVATP
jgi:SAM-dependent methyltransferase